MFVISYPFGIVLGFIGEDDIKNTIHNLSEYVTKSPNESAYFYGVTDTIKVEDFQKFLIDTKKDFDTLNIKENSEKV